jgi:serine/threonine protein kinase
MTNPHPNSEKDGSGDAGSGDTLRISTVHLSGADLIEDDELQTGRTIRGFRIIEPLGVGGFGEVFKAEQVHLRRLVAFKVLKPGMDSREIIARFDAEQKTLALMDHPNIAKIIDGALTPRGRMFFAMEFVGGVAITTYCDRRRLGVLERLELFLQVCDAIHHAHQKGIIHRDIKPNNILVAERDNKPFPKVIDFGIAKAVHGHLSEQGVHTIQNHFLGTPVYMSPEQAERSGLEIDARSDIYSLGVLLYELLCGVTPIDGNDLGRNGIEAIRKLILEKDPRKPSTRIIQYNDDMAQSVARCRDCDVGRLVHTLSRDLDRIVIKCLEKDRNRRYASVHELMADLQAYLEGARSTSAPQAPSRPIGGWQVRRLIIGSLVVLALTVWEVLSTRSTFTAEQQFAKRFGMPYPPPAGQFVRVGDEFTVRWIPAGRFIMGTPADEFNRSVNETEHEVLFHLGFFLSETECTQAQWESVMGTRPSRSQGPQLPVEQVDWNEALEFCRRLTAKHRLQGRLPDGWEWRLPTEAEWEYAARAGTVGPRHGDLDTIAWHAGNSGGTTRLVGRKQANAWGLHDMMGNVWEWCSDWHGDYPPGNGVHPKGAASGTFRVFRGGCFRLGESRKFRSGYRSGSNPELRTLDVGFRPALAQVVPID